MFCLLVEVVFILNVSKHLLMLNMSNDVFLFDKSNFLPIYLQSRPHQPPSALFWSSVGSC